MITQWTSRLTIAAPAIPTKLKLLRPTGTPNEYKVVAESALENVLTGGENAFKTRITAQAGDRIGSYSSASTLYCTTGNAGDVIAVLGAGPGEIALNATATKGAALAGATLALGATLETDADKDGFGDETQDGCPGSAKTQVPCPTTKLSSFSLPGAKSFKLLIGVTNDAAVTVSGTVAVPQPAKKKTKRSASAAAKAKTLTLGPLTKNVTVGAIGEFELKYPKSLKSALRKLSRKKSLKLTVTATAPNIAGAPTTATVSAKLKGTASPKTKTR